MAPGREDDAEVRPRLHVGLRLADACAFAAIDDCLVFSCDVEPNARIDAQTLEWCPLGHAVEAEEVAVVVDVEVEFVRPGNEAGGAIEQGGVIEVRALCVPGAMHVVAARDEIDAWSELP